MQADKAKYQSIIIAFLVVTEIYVFHVPCRYQSDQLTIKYSPLTRIGALQRTPLCQYLVNNVGVMPQADS